MEQTRKNQLSTRAETRTDTKEETKEDTSREETSREETREDEEEISRVVDVDEASSEEAAVDAETATAVDVETAQTVEMVRDVVDIPSGKFSSPLEN